MMSRRDRRVLDALCGLLVTLPLFLGGRQPVAVVSAAALVVALLVATVRARRGMPDAPQAPGVAALAAFALLALATTVPLPPAILRCLSPALARLTAVVLPAWPDGGAWSRWRPLAMDPYGVTLELTRIAIALGAFTVIVAYPWRCDDSSDDGRRIAFGRLVLSAIAGGVLLAALALLERIAGNGRVLWIGDETFQDGRASGSFVNPNHLAAWLEMIFPIALAYAIALALRLRRRLARTVHAGRGMGVQARRAWISAVIAQQRRLWPPLAGAAAAALILVAHLATRSRGGGAALLAALALATALAAGALRRGRARWIPFVATLALVIGVLGALALRAVADQDAAAVVESTDVSLASRIAVSVAGSAIVRDFPVFGTGLGSWIHAFRPHQEPPVPGGSWDHAHDDYLELVADTGLAGVALVLLFAFGVARAIHRAPAANGRDVTVATPAIADSAPAISWAGSATRGSTPPGFETSEWYAALGERTVLRLGLAGGVFAILVHSLVDFGLRLPANLLLLMTLLGLLVLSGRRPAAAGGRSVAVLAAAIALAVAPQLANAMLRIVGAAPIAPRDCLETADTRLAEDGDPGRGAALALVRRALDRNPFDREAHEALATTLGPGPAAEDALRRALALEPWSSSVRDQLALALWERGERPAAVAELEESMRRMPALAAHAYLSPETTLQTHDPAPLLRSLVDGDTVELRLTLLAPEMVPAIERGLTRALDGAADGPARAAVVDDLATLLEVRERWADAARMLHDEAGRSADAGADLARAARDYLRAHDDRPAEETLLAALVHDPDQGDLYRRLAVDVYAARGDFKTADTVLEAAEQNAVDLLPVYRAVNEVLAQRAAAEEDHAALAWTPGDHPVATEAP